MQRRAESGATSRGHALGEAVLSSDISSKIAVPLRTALSSCLWGCQGILGGMIERSGNEIRIRNGTWVFVV